MSSELSQLSGDSLSKLVIGGDLSSLSPQQKMEYYAYRCKALDLDPSTKPFDIITLSGKQVLYATRETANQLSSKRQVSVTVVSRTITAGISEVVARASSPDGRMTDEIGCVSIEGMKGEALSNALMKAVTKAKRRAVLSHCGLGMMDETEVDSVPGAIKVTASSSLSSAAGLPPAGFSQPVKVKEAPKPPAPEPVAPQQEEPAVILDHPAEAEPAIFEQLTHRSGVSKGKPWNLYGVSLLLESGERVRANLFENVGHNDSSVAALKGLAPNAECRVVLKDGKPFNGQPTVDLVYIGGVK